MARKSAFAMLVGAGLLVGVTCVRADTPASSPMTPPASPVDGYYVDHQEALDRGGIGNYAPQYTGHDFGGYVYQQPGEVPEVADTGRFVDHRTAVELGGVGNYVSAGTKAAVVKTDRYHNQGIVYFDPGQSNLTEAGKRQVSKVASELKANSSMQVEVSGFTDDTGDTAYNDHLSDARADSVKSALLNEGVQPEQVMTQGFGSGDPIASNDTASGRSVNRRAEIYLNTPSTTTG